MENILSKGNKNLITGIIIVFILVLILLVFLSVNFRSDIEYSFDFIEKDIKSAELILKKKISKYIKRASEISNKQKVKNLLHSDLSEDEAFIETENGIITKYKGAINFFKYSDLKKNRWKFIKQDMNIYFLYKIGENLFYISFFSNLEKNNFAEEIDGPFLVKEMKFISNGLIQKEKSHFKKIGLKEIYFFEKVLENSNNQFLLYLKFSEKDFSNFIKKKTSDFLSFILFFMLILIIISAFYVSKFNIRNCRSKIQGYIFLKYFLFIILFFSILNIIARFGSENLEISIFGIDIFFVNQLFFILLGTIVLLVLISKFLKFNFIALILINVLFPLLLSFSYYLLRNCTVPISEFVLEIGYLSLISTLFLIFILPFVLIRNFDLGNSKKKKTFFFVIQALALFLFVFILKLNFILSILYIVSIIFLVLLKKSIIIRRIIYVIITAALISTVINISFSDLKKEFVSSNLKRIFLNQENYSKLVIGEIIEEFELSKIGLKSFFDKKKKIRNESILADIWNHSIASKESIASGIYVLDKNKNIINQFSFKIPYLNLKPTLELPVWTTEETDGTLYGKELSVSFGSIKVNDNAEHLGYIVIQVLNSPEMILRNSGLTIFGLDKKLKNAKLNYLKLKGYKIIENPLNINLNNIIEIVKYKDKWFSFSFMENRYEGYRFISGDHSIIIFSPQKDFIEWIAEVIKISILFILIFVIMSANEIKGKTLSFIYYSLSSRIFIILSLLSLISIILFSLLIINYNNQTVQSEFRNKILKKGRISQNLIGQLLEDSGNLTQNDVFFVANIIDNDIHVYSENELFFSSNYKEIYDLKIPKHIHSNTVEMFGREKQSYFIEGKKDNFNLYFKIYKYIFCINFTFNEKDYNFGKDRSIDFIISLFFLLLLGSSIIVIFVRNKIMAPILFLNEKMSEVEKGNLKKIQFEPIENELKTLYSGFNSMLIGVEEQKKNASDIARMKAVIKLGRRVAHEVKNPLTPIKLSAEQILKSINDKKENYDDLIRKSVNYIVSETDHLKKVAHGFLDLSHIDGVDKEDTELVSLIEDQFVFFKQSYSSIDFNIIKGIKKINVFLDRLKITQLLKNIIINSIEAIDKKKGIIELSIKKEGDSVIIKISDNGIGINTSDMNLLFDEDYSTKEIGTGIGLFVAKRIVDLHNGKIEIESGKVVGTIVTVSLPIKNAERKNKL